MFLHLRSMVVSRRRMVAAATVVAVSLAGFGLWADVPGPKPDHNVRVESLSTRGTVQPATNIAIKFSNDLVPRDSLNRPVHRIPVEFSPDIPGQARWAATDVLMIYPGQPLRPATQYQVIVRAGGGYVNGNAIGQDQKFSFRTPPLAVEVVRYSAQRTRGNPRQARLLFELEFNYPVERQQLQRALHIEGHRDATRSTLSVIWPDSALDGTPLTPEASQFRLATEPFDLRKGEQQYQVTIQQGLRCAGCGLGLAADYTYTMKVPRNPRLDLWVEQVQAQRPGKQGSIVLQFSAPVPTEEIRNHVSLDPTVPFTVERSWRGALLRGYFKPQAVYTVNIAAGLMSNDGALLERDYSGRVQMGDLPPSIRFTSPGLYLPSDGSRLLEIATTNVDTLTIEISQVFANNLVTYMATGADRGGRSRGSKDPFGRSSFVMDFPLEARKNQELISTVDVGAIIGDTLRGVFIVSARTKTRRWTSDSRHVMITDLGVMARMSESYLMVWTNTLSQAEPVSRATVKLFSRNNQLLLEGRTNSKGVVVFADITDQIEGFQPFLITVEKDGDLSYLRLDNTRLPTGDFDVSGRPYLTEGYEAFLYMDRGVFRPGETAHLVAMVRGEDGARPASFPYLVKIADPRGRAFREYRLTADQTMSSIDINLPADILTGRYQVTASLSDDHVLGQAGFLVEEFVPDRIKVTVETDRSLYQTGDTISVTVNGHMLYGAPAAGCKVTSEIILSPQDFRPVGYAAYSFRESDRESSVKKTALGETQLSDSGMVRFQHVVAEGHRPPGQLSATVWATVSEAGGRSVSSNASATVYPYGRYVGIRTDLEGYARIGEPVNAHIIVLHPDGQSVTADSVEVMFSRLVYNSMLQRQSDGSYRFVSEQTVEPIDSLWVSIDADGATASFTPADYGRYQIVVTDRESGHAADIQFFATGWGRVPWSLAEPDRLQLDLDQSDYLPGSRARLQVRAPFSGRVLVTIENEAVQDYLIVDLPENTAEIKIPVKRDYSPNVYISATLIRPAGDIHKYAPARAFGMVPLMVTARDRRLDMVVEAPAEVRPRSTLSLGITTNGSHETVLTVAAVDAGILQLTDFTTPDPFGFFYGKRRPALNGYDLYSLVYPETERAGSHLSPPGGVAADRQMRHLNPFAARRVNVVSLWSGVVGVDSTGRARVDFDVPEFNGQLIVMAVAGDDDRFGSSSSSLLVREPIIIQESFPRFVSPGDEVNGLVTVFNGLDTAATILVDADIAGAAELTASSSQQVFLERRQQGSVIFGFKSGLAPGKIDVNIHARAGTEESHVSFELANRPAVSLTTEFGSGVVQADSPAVFTLPGGWVEGTGEYILRTSSLGAVQFARNIEYLLRYPYGCVEQTTSALFPLLYFDDLAKVVRPELFGGRGHEYYLAEGIDRLLRFQQSSGAFSYWPGSERIHHWSSIYAAHFLIEAKLAGYDVEKSGYKKAVRFLENIARNRQFSDVTTEHRIYACLALAKAGELEKKEFNFLSTVNSIELPPYSAYQLAAALALAGDVDHAREIVPFDIQPDLSEPDHGGNFSSGVRTNAILLDLLLEVDPHNPSTAALAKSLLEQARFNRWYNTQATAFALVSLGKYFSRTEPADFVGKVSIEGGESYRIDATDFSVSSEDMGGRKITIQIDGQGPCFYYWQASGVPTAPMLLEYDRGVVVRREYLDETGSPVD
ncbi:MAG: hypothetical protein JSU65_08525, partial [Candidatus Zixiibacteriota bacterium]